MNVKHLRKYDQRVSRGLKNRFKERSDEGKKMLNMYITDQGITCPRKCNQRECSKFYKKGEKNIQEE